MGDIFPAWISYVAGIKQEMDYQLSNMFKNAQMIDG